MSDLSYREACSLNKARDRKPKEPLKGGGMLCTPQKPVWAFVVFLLEALELSWKNEDMDMLPPEHAVGRIQIFSSHRTPSRLPPQDSTELCLSTSSPEEAKGRSHC